MLQGILFLLVFAGSALAAPDGNWPQFRGPDARGIAEGAALPDRWTATENVAWKTDIPGRGWSSPIVWGDRVYLTTVVNLGESEPPKKGLYNGGNRMDVPQSTHQWKVYCLDLKSGKVLWEKQVREGAPTAPIHVKNSYASETPVTDGERVYAYFGNVGIWCFDMDGKDVWNREIAPQRMAFGWGTASSPVVHGDRLYIVNDNLEASWLLALDKKTGKEIWKVAREEKSNWSTPYVWTNEQRTEIVTPGSGLVRSYDLDGKLLWSFKGMSSITIATPYSSNGLLFLSSGYVGDKRRPLYAIRPGASGDISLAQGQTSNQWIAWSYPQAGPYNPTTLAYNDRIYVLYDGGALACFNAADGAVVYERTKIPEGGNFTTSPWAYGNRIFCLNEDGVTFVIKAGDKFEVLNTNPLSTDDMGMATPAIVNDRLLLRTSSRIYCIRNAETK
jgi:outer membrane protein assembly factor BamB